MVQSWHQAAVLLLPSPARAMDVTSSLSIEELFYLIWAPSRSLSEKAGSCCAGRRGDTGRSDGQAVLVFSKTAGCSFFLPGQNGCPGFRSTSCAHARFRAAHSSVRLVGDCRLHRVWVASDGYPPGVVVYLWFSAIRKLP